jgi:hypothetical protein
MDENKTAAPVEDEGINPEALDELTGGKGDDGYE